MQDVEAIQSGLGHFATSVEQVPSSQVPQWSQVRVPEGVKAPDDIANLFGGNVNPLLLLGAVAAIAVPALLFQVNPCSRVPVVRSGPQLHAQDGMLSLAIRP